MNDAERDINDDTESHNNDADDAEGSEKMGKLSIGNSEDKSLVNIWPHSSFYESASSSAYE